MLLWLMPAPATAAPALRPVAAQMTDMSCGLAALANFLTWAGKPVTEAELTALFDSRVARGDEAAKARLRDQGASASELVALVAAFDSSLVLEPALVTMDQARALASRETYMAYLVEGIAGGGARSHFTLVVGHSPATGWLRADSIGGNHFRQSDDDFERAALVQRNGSRTLILRLRRGTRAAVGPEDDAAIENGQIPWIAASRLLASLGGTDAAYAHLDIGHYRDRFAADGAVIRSAATATTLSVSYPLSSKLTFNASVPYTVGNLHIGIPGASDFDLGGQSGFGPVSLGLTHHFRAGKKSTSTLTAGGSVRLGRNARPEGMTLRGGISRPVGKRTVATGQVAFDFDKSADGWAFGISPAISINRMLGAGLAASANIAAVFPLADGSRPTVTGSIGVSRQFGKSWGLGINAGGTLISMPGHRSRWIGFSLTRRIGIPRSEFK